jgi:Mrp family chromosome partitioning ATPase
MAAVQANQFQMLRARIETALKAPYSLLISSATANDGKSVCAQGLASSMAAAGHSTLLIDLDHDAPRLQGLPQIKSLKLDHGTGELDRAMVLDPKTGLTLLALSNAALSATASKANVSAVIAYLRTRFDTIVIDAARITESSIGTIFASECDAVILATREGRTVRAEDRATLETLDRENAKFFGVVTIGAKAIAEFAKVGYVPNIRQAAAPFAVAVPKAESPLTKSMVI